MTATNICSNFGSKWSSPSLVYLGRGRSVNNSYRLSQILFHQSWLLRTKTLQKGEGYTKTLQNGEGYTKTLQKGEGYTKTLQKGEDYTKTLQKGDG